MNRDTATILALTTLWTLVVAAVGALVLWQFRRRSLRTAMIVAALVPMAAALAAVLQSVRAMFISAHDSWVVLWTLAFSALLGVGLSVLIGHWVTAGSRDVGRRLRHLGTSYEPPAAAPTGTVPAELAALTDELELTRMKLAASHEREQALEASRRELVAFMSHDLRTPLAGLRAVSEGLEDGVIDDVPGALRQMRATVDRMTGLVEDLFELSRLSSTPEPRRRTAVSLRELADDVVGENAEHARAKAVALCVEAPGDDRFAVEGDPDELTRAVTNLVDNAIRHTKPEKQVTVSVDRAADGGVSLAVTDACGGIPPEDLDRVFDVGWRGDAGRTPAHGGAGLGLAIARGIVESHHGTIAVSNVPDGCSFRLELPAVQP
ncbi:sensor histidine kinase [Kribbella sp. CA-247076]|uniref:sensor histidine kinase n=1 Tax=Kribbella sp. CA-247076 TaxID=3239941 RepID=UPI003D950AA4